MLPNFSLIKNAYTVVTFSFCLARLHPELCPFSSLSIGFACHRDGFLIGSKHLYCHIEFTYFDDNTFATVLRLKSFFS